MDKQYSERFLNAFSEIEKHLRKLSGLERSKPFDSHLESAAGKRGPAQFYKIDLKEYADLRNAIVHERRDGRPIAEPHPETVASIEAIRDVLLTPPKLIPEFQKRVMICTPNDRVGDAAKKMHDGSFSQLPVYQDQKFIGLLTAETIARWLASRLGAGDGILEEENVEVVLEHTEDPDNFALLGRDNTVFDAMTAFEEYSHKGKYLDAIVVTLNGKRAETPLGIITIFDFPGLLSLAGTKRKI